MSTPWLRDDNRYTWADVANMSRGEFDRRRELHVIYRAETPHVAEDFSRRLPSIGSRRRGVHHCSKVPV